MRKNKMMRAASGILVATLMTTSIISGTFAKYTTSITGEDRARVAAWGVGQNSDIKFDNLFSNVYANDSNKNTVYSYNTGADLIAPGTKGQATFQFGYQAAKDPSNSTRTLGAPEVAYTFKVSTEGSTIGNQIKDNKNIQWKLDNNEWTDWENFLKQIQALDGTEGEDGKEYMPGNLPTGFDATSPTHKVQWQWMFSTSENDDGTDTLMTMDLPNYPLESVNLKISVTAEQID